MSKIKCRCGNILPDITDRIRHKGYIISDMEIFDLFDFADEIIAKQRKKAHYITCDTYVNVGVGEKYIRLKEMYQCPFCGRMIIEDNSGDFCFFAPEEHNEKNLLDYGAECEKKHI